MKQFKGFDDWVEIFRGGKQTDSQGREHDGDALIEKAVATFDAAHHEPPVAVGHPTDNAPAFGWIQQLKTGIRGGIKSLYARFKDVVPEFATAVEQGLYKKRSASFYPDGRLRHVGFLGAAPPAVKALADLKFADDDEAIVFDFYDPGLGTIARILRGVRDWLIEKEGKEKADEIIPDWDVEYIKDLSNKEDEISTGRPSAFGGAVSIIDDSGGAADKKEGNMSGFKERVKNLLSFMGVDMSKVPDDALPVEAPDGVAADSFTEADVEAARKKAEDDTRKKVETEFAEKGRQERQEARKAEISTWCEQMVKDGKLTPALVKYGLPELLSFMATTDDAIEFGEEKTKATPYDRLKGIFETELPRLVNFGEVARRGEAIAGDGSAGDKLDKLTKKKMAEDKALSYSDAFREVQKDNPDLVQEYQQEISQAA